MRQRGKSQSTGPSEGNGIASPVTECYNAEWKNPIISYNAGIYSNAISSPHFVSEDLTAHALSNPRRLIRLEMTGD